ncbi:hypothetical protein GC176_16275 [bacterium]|nr:hypothetical protein [bacterium]
MARRRFVSRVLSGPAVVLSGLGVLLATSVLLGEPQKTPPSANEAAKTQTAESQADNEQPEENQRVTVPEARRQAKLLHDTYVATLHTVHRTYFDENSRDVIPARALESVFREIDHETGGQTRWIAVNTPAMNIDHKPKPGFEKDAARQLAKGDREFERIENGVYHRAGAVSLFAGCTKCHLSGIRPQQGVRSVAGLVISVPVKAE